MDGVPITITVTPEAAEALRDPVRADAVGRLVSGILQPGTAAQDPLAAMIAEVKADARAAGLSDEEIAAELAAHDAEHRH